MEPGKTFETTRPWLSILTVAAAVALASAARADTLTWNLASGGDWDTTTANWTGDDTQYADPDVDDVIFNNTAGGTIAVQGGGVSPLSTTVSAASGTYEFSGGAIGSSGGLLKSGGGTLQLGETYYGFDYTGDTQIDGGVLRVDHNGGITDHSFGGSTVLNGGTLRFQHTGAGHFNPSLSFTSGIEVSASGGTIDFAGAANNFSGNSLSGPTLAGDLVVSGITGNSGVTYNFTNSGITLNASSKITNATGSGGNTHTVNLSPNISGSAYTLTLDKSGNGTGFQINGPTASSIDLAGLSVGDDAFLYVIPGNGVDPFNQIHTVNGGQVTMGTGSHLRFQGTTSSDGPIYDPSAVSWQGNGTLTIERATGGNRDTYLQVSNGDLEVSTASGLTTLNARPWRAYYTIDSSYALIIGDGGTLNYTVGSNVREEIRGDVTFLDGATIVGINDGGNPGGIIRDGTGGGTLTLGDGSASVITVQGNQGADPDSFNLGFAGNVDDQGNVVMKYANTSSTAGNFFNIGWSAGGSDYDSPLTAFQETSGGTEFAPLAGSGGVAVVGPDSGTVATFNNPASVTTAGTVGFYNEVNTNQRGALGDVVVDGSNGSLTIDLTAGTVQASTLTVSNGGTLGGHGTYEVGNPLTIDGTLAPGEDDNPGNEVGTLTVSGGSLDLQDGATYTWAFFDTDTTDVTDAQGGLTFGSTATLDIRVFGEADFSDSFLLFTYTGADPTLPTWSFDVSNNTGINFVGTPSVVVNTLDNEIYVTGFTTKVMPEPSSIMFLLMGAALVGRRLRGRGGRNAAAHRLA